MATGCGNEPIGRGARGLRADQPLPSQGDDLNAIRKRYCGPKTLSVQNVALAQNQAQRFDLTGTPINQIILTGNTGQINGYFGDYTSGNGQAPVTPHFVASAAIVPVTEVISLPPGDDYIFTLQASGGASTGTVTFCYV